MLPAECIGLPVYLNAVSSDSCSTSYLSTLCHSHPTPLRLLCPTMVVPLRFESRINTPAAHSPPPNILPYLSLRSLTPLSHSHFSRDSHSPTYEDSYKEQVRPPRCSYHDSCPTFSYWHLSTFVETTPQANEGPANCCPQGGPPCNTGAVTNSAFYFFYHHSCDPRSLHRTILPVQEAVPGQHQSHPKPAAIQSRQPRMTMMTMCQPLGRREPRRGQPVLPLSM